MVTPGRSFAPTPDQQRSGKSVGNVQQAIQLLSLRLPRTLGANAPTPAQNLQGPPEMGGLAQWLQRWLGGMQTLGGAPSMAGAAPPNPMGMAMGAPGVNIGYGQPAPMPPGPQIGISPQPGPIGQSLPDTRPSFSQGRMGGGWPRR